FSPKLLEQAGLVVEKTRPFDRFKGRVLFSIRDPQGRPVAFGGRLLPGSSHQDGAKYINSPETPLFSKSRMLYGFDLARPVMRRENCRAAVVMEGYTDVAVAHQSGIENAVAVLGVALTEQHIAFLKRFVDRIVLVLDGDDAGRKRANELLKMFVAEQVDLRILTLPEGLDPCDFLLQRGGEEFQRMLTGAPDALEHKFQWAASVAESDAGIHASNAALEETLATIAKAPRLGLGTQNLMRLKEEQILNRLSQRFRVSEEALRRRLSDLRDQGAKRVVAARPAAEETPRRQSAPGWESELMEIILVDPELMETIRGHERSRGFTDPRLIKLFRRCCEFSDQGVVPTFDRLMTDFDDSDMKRVLIDWKERGDNQS
ncbi:MAG: toprim domain-containing protein, partial [Planctomycetales bacterium]